MKYLEDVLAQRGHRSVEVGLRAHAVNVHPGLDHVRGPLLRADLEGVVVELVALRIAVACERRYSVLAQAVKGVHTTIISAHVQSVLT